mgnify:CR=1 FL=1
MKQFSFEVTLHPCIDKDTKQPTGRHSVLFTPKIVDTDEDRILEDILLVSIDQKTFNSIAGSEGSSDAALPVARQLSDLMTICDMSEDDISELAHCIRLAAIESRVRSR